MSNKIFFILLACYLGSISCEIFDIGTCPTPTTFSPSDAAKFYGKWYEIARVESGTEKGLRCVTFDIASNASYLSGHPVTQTGFDDKNNEYIYIGNLQMWDDQTVFEYGNFDILDIDLAYGYTVVDTDYDNYAIVLGCSELPPFGYWFPFLLVRIRVAWILSRTPTLDAELQSKLVDLLAKNGVGQSKLTFNKFDSCPSYY
ncbi:apolipoprotein D [Tetranychus urticae]|uniref:Lipocalin/cytosolic fatty-acid binding domain-containing protein n=1 Tax=Tetranychus urticae TaxID=32264 RepID=T1K977_TETUR|nr:apolipoprotein D [Tetranychus urticae]